MSEQENSCEIQVDDAEPNHIEIVVKTREPARPPICKQFDKVEHLKTDEWIENFKRLHPECFR